MLAVVYLPVYCFLLWKAKGILLMKVQSVLLTAYKEEPVIFIFSARKTEKQMVASILKETGLAERYKEDDLELPASFSDLSDAMQVDINLTIEKVL